MNMSNPDGSSASISPDDWERIARYVTGEATVEEARATQRWIESDTHLAEVVRVLESILANVARDATNDIDVESALNDVRARMHEPKVLPFAPRAGDRPRSSRTLGALLRVAAAIIIIVGGVLLWDKTRESRLESSEQTYATNVGERRQVVLKDGTRVLLGPTSRLVALASSVNDGQRLVALDGIAYFNVVHDPAHPFTVRAGSISIQDIGTAFAVENDDSAGTRVAVDSGSVAIGAADQNHVRGAVLKARDRATVDAQGVVSVERSAVSEDDIAWTQGRLVFRDAPLILVGAELYRWYGVRLRVADSSLVNLHLTASFSGEPIDRVLEVIALTLGARVERQGNVAIVRRATASGGRP